MSDDVAAKCFAENIALYAVKSPERTNLYQGLKALAESVERLRKDVARLEVEVRKLRSGR